MGPEFKILNSELSSIILILVSCVGHYIYSQLSARRSRSCVCPRGPTKEGAYKSILFIESSHVVKIKKHLVDVIVTVCHSLFFTFKFSKQWQSVNFSEA